MILGAFLLGFAAYSFQASLGYFPDFKRSSWFFPVGILTSTFAAIIWFWLVRKCGDDHAKILRYGFIWDSMIFLAYAIVPICGFGVRVDFKTAMGMALLVAGTLVLKG